jgi:hypothetical protein
MEKTGDGMVRQGSVIYDKRSTAEFECEDQRQRNNLDVLSFHNFRGRAVRISKFLGKGCFPPVSGEKMTSKVVELQHSQWWL